MTDNPTHRDWGGVMALGLIWGATFMVVSIALEGYGPVTVAAARTTLGAVALLAVMVITGRGIPRWDRTLWNYIVWIGLLSTALPFVLLSWGQQFVPSAFAGLSMAAIPLMVLPLAHFFSDEPLNTRKFIGVSLGFCGALVLIGPGLTQLGQGAEPLAQLACIGAALCYSVASIFTRRCPPVDPVTLAALTLVVGSLVLLPVMLATEGVPGWSGSRSGLAIIALGLVPTALATLLRVSIIRSAGSVFMTLVNYQVPVWSMVFGAWVLSEALPLRFFIALALILTGLAISQWVSLTRMLKGSGRSAA
ncbi:Permease of the drug/metabolite transporter (DMT) superfamily [Aliiroseovarius sediminilitoris]|uniref:Permease of the drug/metabolite transporter (DMT) superfamily n=1 Tax=Aliiroseovarius sediminilitoris TaxID=1173584 RepID=A0A1I0QNM5_9RHOB|nr:DMT family transporter [Aliiroseovarius sediminilitoris]SEW28855.1 Permease of the drug/metabolite transporter (DMT) superfamily [Aliiroseovarius sediminilitoris]